MPDPVLLKKFAARVAALPEPDATASAEYDDWAAGNAAATSERRTVSGWRFIDALPLTTADRALLRDGKLDPAFKSMQATERWLASNVPLLGLCGPVGRGKTLAGVWVAAKASGAYVGAREAERIFGARYGDDRAEYLRLRGARVLVLDDLGRERDVAGMGEALLDLVDYRRGTERTLLISNFSADQLRERYPDPRLWSRLKESARWVYDKGPDQRG
jgi:hypothetical protein